MYGKMASSFGFGKRASAQGQGRQGHKPIFIGGFISKAGGKKSYNIIICPHRSQKTLWHTRINIGP
jgi:hypothetical protein